MCLIAFHCGDHSRFRFALAANRDEFHARASAPAALRAELPGTVIGGRDEVAGGGWLLAAADGRLAAVTNVRTGRRDSLPHSRGALVDRFLRARIEAEAFAASLRGAAADYGPFNLLAWDGARSWHVGNHPAFHAAPVAPGPHALSNGSLDAPWPKSRALGAALADWLDSPAAARELPDTEPLFAALADRREAPDTELPSTGVPLDWERRLSAAFIVGEEYGTRCSSVVLFDRQGGLHFEERRFGPGGVAAGMTRWHGGEG